MCPDLYCEQPLVLRSAVRARSLLNYLLRRLLFIELGPIKVLRPRLREEHDLQLVVCLDPR